MKRLLLLSAIAFLISSCCKEKTENTNTGNGATDSLRINQIQVIASHNSYHLKTDSAVFAGLEQLANSGLLPSQYNPAGIDYTHESLEAQLSTYGVRGFELDIHNDPAGGQYYYRQGPALAGLSANSQVPELLQPGFKIIHIVDFDYNTTHFTFVSALTAVKLWSEAHPNHLPLFINVETKEDAPADAIPGLGLTSAIPFDADACDKMDEEIKSVFGNDLHKVITPDDVRGSFATLEEAALNNNWPQLAKARGKVVFIMQGGAESEYKSGHPSLQGRAMFVYASPGTPEAAFVILNDPVSKFTQIQQRVSQGYIVRTRSDSNTDQARSGDYTDMNAAFASWAQIVSTDYYRPDPRAGTTGWTDYHVQFPNHELARIDSISASTQLNLGVLKE